MNPNVYDHESRLIHSKIKFHKCLSSDFFLVLANNIRHAHACLNKNLFTVI